MSDPRGYGPRLAAAEREAWRQAEAAMDAVDNAREAEDAALAQWRRCRDDLRAELARVEGER